MIMNVFAAVLFTVVSGGVDAKQIHAILIGDTSDATIGAGVVSNLASIRGLLGAVQSEAQVPVSFIEVKDGSFNCRAIWSAINALTIDRDDTVLFFYSGHGFKSSSSATKFPEFDCRRAADDARAELAGIVTAIREKGPRLVVGISDTCNKETMVTPGPTIASAAPAVDRGPGFRRLFLDYSGTLMMTAAEPNQFAWYVNGGPLSGGFFTNQLLKVIDSRVKRDGAKVRWEDISSDATRKLIIPVPGDPTEQQPVAAELGLNAPPT